MEGFTLLGKRTAIAGKTMSGKSNLLKYILSSEKHKFDKIYCISATENVNGFYSSIIDKENIFNEFSEIWLEKLIKKLTDYKTKNNKAYNICLIFDDLGSDKEFQNSKSLAKISCRGRHIGLSFCLLIQYVNQIPPVIKVNLNYIICGQSNAQSTELLLDNWLFGEISRKEFIDMYNNATRDYGFLIINCDSVKDNSNLNSIYGILRASI